MGCILWITTDEGYHPCSYCHNLVTSPLRETKRELKSPPKDHLYLFFGLIREWRSLRMNLEGLYWGGRFWTDFIRVLHLELPRKNYWFICLCLKWGRLLITYLIPLQTSMQNSGFGGSWNLNLIWISNFEWVHLYSVTNLISLITCFHKRSGSLFAMKW